MPSASPSEQLVAFDPVVSDRPPRPRVMGDGRRFVKPIGRPRTNGGGRGYVGFIACPEDRELLEQISYDDGVTFSVVLRRAFREYAAARGYSPPEKGAAAATAA